MAPVRLADNRSTQRVWLSLSGNYFVPSRHLKTKKLNSIYWKFSWLPVRSGYPHVIINCTPVSASDLPTRPLPFWGIGSFLQTFNGFRLVKCLLCCCVEYCVLMPYVIVSGNLFPAKNSSVPFPWRVGISGLKCNIEFVILNFTMILIMFIFFSIWIGRSKEVYPWLTNRCSHGLL